MPLFKRILLGCFCLSLASAAVEAQKADPEIGGRIHNEVIVMLQPGERIDDWLPTIANSQLPTLRFARTISLRSNVHLLLLDEKGSDPANLLDAITKLPGVQAAQWDYALTFRETTPNDLDFSLQQNMHRIGVQSAWDHTTGGLTANGDTIVVAIMDSGFQPTHEDIAPNIWHNREEILGDSIDNDGNGYIDDDIGWNYFLNSPDISIGSHGLSASGIIGARGNNALGVAGINWQVKMMQFTFVRITDLLQSYDYIIDQRRRYNASGGSEGAFVVAVNHSFGQERVQCSQQPIWGGYIDSLGTVGILLAAGTANINVNVDTAGDMPTTCASDFLLTTCNLGLDDRLYTNSAYGKTHIDLGSPGEQSYTTKLDDSYGNFGNNSAAAPHLTGAIALMYAVDCPDFANDALTRPTETALKVRQAILGGVEKLTHLEDITATGGKLDVNGSMELLLSNCPNTPGVLETLDITTLFPNPNGGRLYFKYTTPEYGIYRATVLNMLGQPVLEETVEVTPEGLRIYDFDVSGLPQGSYVLRFGKGEESVSEKFLLFRE